MTFVLDASVALSWCFPDESNEYAQDVFRRLSADDAVAPAIWPFEAANALVVGSRRGRITVEQAREGIRLLAKVGVKLDSAVELTSRSALELAVVHGLSVYDAAYLALAQRLNVPLATADQKLQRAARELMLSIV